MWHSDKTVIQQELANRLGELMFALPNDHGIMTYIRAFHWTILKEWHAIDKLRLDKFYSLIRSVVFHSFKYLAKKAWDLTLTKQLAQIFIDLPLNTSHKPEVVVSPGVAFHLPAIYM
jgi:ribosomal RNA-processing protein 1